MVGAKASVLSRIADHNAVEIELPLAAVTETSVTRTVWHLKGAKWKLLKQELKIVDWTPLRRDTSEDALLFFLQVLWTALLKRIPRKDVTCIKSNHLWLNSRCRATVAQKNNAKGSGNFRRAQGLCSEVLHEE